MGRRELGCILLGLLTGALAIGLGACDPVWEWIGLDLQLRGPLTIAFSVCMVNAGFLFAVYVLVQSGHSALSARLRALLAALPQAQQLTVYSGADALTRLCEPVASARSVLNTRIAHVPRMYEPAERVMSQWEEAI